MTCHVVGPPGGRNAPGHVASEPRVAADLEASVECRRLSTSGESFARPVAPREVSGLAAAACSFHGFSDPSRITILQHLALGEHRVVDVTARLGLAQSTVSKHLACLRDCGLVTARTEGRATLYSLNYAEALLVLWSAAERLLTLTGDPVTLGAGRALGFERCRCRLQSDLVVHVHVSGAFSRFGLQCHPRLVVGRPHCRPRYRGYRIQGGP